MKRFPISPFFLAFAIFVLVLVTLNPDLMLPVVDFLNMNFGAGLVLFYIFWMILCIILIVLSVLEIVEYIIEYWNITDY
ncbi:hypothetical protein Mpet_1126 [Methanolacinia petrolearia DSM 11571]|uniref:Uncharacterized protein n=1 Tax=Methanolacinia petrolearia (strain DSM 11571 / OCM 486 / SEBR 4847) TaxID=679926 RepID=E1RCZ2_METP4|nr:hypothetical protein Mpet_1126 [Methanolacinia petrolearia DSM 11571]